MEIGCTIGQACTRDLDGLAIGTIHSTIAVSHTYVHESVFLIPKSNAKIPPIGFTLEWKLRSGASYEISAGLVCFPGAALMVACWARRVIDMAGQPWPGPWRFCSVIREVMMCMFFEALELSIRNMMAIGGLLMACPAETLAFRA